MATILENHYVLAVHNARATANFFVNVLGFAVVAEPVGWVFVKKDACLIMIGERPNDLPPADIGCHNYFAYLRVDDVDGYFARVKAAGGEPRSEPRDQPWGMREFGVKTPEGHRVMIAQVIETTPASS
jgi:uncharacterized glyoxalase superfamily protein PhnB